MLGANVAMLKYQIWGPRKIDYENECLQHFHMTFDNNIIGVFMKASDIRNYY